MNLGKRIESRLSEIGEERSFLFDLIPELTPARLSALIKRDSKRCELDVQIAKALKVRLEWLNDGELPKLIEGESVRVDVKTKTASVMVITPPPADQEFINEVSTGLQEREIPDHIRQTILTLIASSPEKS